MLSILITALVFIIIILIGGFHVIDESCIGVYYINGVLQKQYSEPGFHFMIPFITTVESTQVTV